MTLDDFELVGSDDWSRPLWRQKGTDTLFIEVDDQLYTREVSADYDYAEPGFPIGVFTK